VSEPLGKKTGQPCAGCPFAPKRAFASLWVMITGFVLAVALCVSYSTYAIEVHTHEACSELRILAMTGGAATRYDQTVRAAYDRLYVLRCG
jgi:hypothetical protein